ncbi:STAS domain-containing protein [Streptomyces sp. NPDC059759]|uniref:STAS domain-containing protein n=1 Tax=Streptomyces sp. NPDC059759 TaxID=3346936 RepID=UPI003654AEF1
MADLPDTKKRPARLSISEGLQAGTRVLVLSGEIDLESSVLLHEAITAHGDALPRVVLDLAAVTFMDSSGIRVLAAAHLAVQSDDGWIRLVALTPPVRRVVDIVGLDTIIPCYSTLAQALANP